MAQLIITETGSRYLIDRKKGTWERIQTGETSGDLRTTGGVFIDVKLAKGQSMALIGPPINDDADGRLVITSRVIEIEEVPEA